MQQAAQKTRKAAVSFHQLLQLFFMVPVLVFGMFAFESLDSRAEAASGINRTINFQGKVVNKSDGTNVTNGNYTFIFSIYNASIAGTQLWGPETQTNIAVTNGIFQVALGSVTSFGSLDFNQDNLWLDITFNGEVFGSRVRLAAVPYALTAEKVSGLTVTNNGGNTLNIAANKTFTVNNSITFSGTDTTTMTLPSTSTTLAGLSIANTFTNGQTISPTQASTVGLTINTSTNATTADALDIVTAHTSGTATNGVLINQNAAGTTTNGLQIKQTSGTLTNGLTFSGTIGTEINLGIIASGSTGISGVLANTTAANATGIAWTTGSITTSGTQNGEAITITAIGAGNTNGILINPPATTTAGGTITALNIGSITTSNGTDTGISVGSNWDKGIAVATGTNGQGIVVTAGGVPTADMVNITNAGQGVTTAGINALSINYVGGAAAVESGALRVDLTPGGTTGGTWNGLRMVANATGPATGVTETGLKVEGPTTGGAGTFSGVNILNLAPGSGGTTNGINITGTTATTGTENAINIASLTPGAGTETGLNIGAGWDKGIAIATNATGQGMVVTAGAVPTADMVNITNTGFGVTTAGINALSITYVGGAAAVESGALRIDLTPGGTSGGTWNGLRMVANATGPATGVTETGLKVEGPTTGGAGTFNGINILNVGAVTTNGTANGINITGTNSNSAGTEVGINIAALTAGAATERAIAIGKGWDSSISFGSLTANDNTAQGVIQFATSGTGTTTCAIGTAQGLVFKDQAGNQIGHFCKDGNTGMKIAANSTLLNGTDVAENYSDIANTLTPGDLVSIDSIGPVKSVRETSQPYEGLLFGIVSTAPGVLLSDVDESNGYTDLINPKPIALTGRVPTHVSTENGPIAVGDYITSSSTPGVGMKATKAGMVVGQALQPYTGSGVGTIYVFTRAGYYNGLAQDAFADVSGDSNVLATTEFGTPVTSIASGNDEIATSAAELLPHNDSLFNTLSVLGIATVSGDLRVKSNAFIEGVMHVTDTLFTNKLLVNDSADFFGPSNFHSDVTFDNTPTFASDTAGLAVIHASSSAVMVAFSKLYATVPVVTASLMSTATQDDLQQTIFQEGYQYLVTNVTPKGFTILLNKKATDDVDFSWHAIAVSTPITFESPKVNQLITPVPTGDISASGSAQ